jgi:hypothetical protein
MCCVCTGLARSIQVIVMMVDTGSHRAPNDDRSGRFPDSRFQEFLNHMSTIWELQACHATAGPHLSKLSLMLSIKPQVLLMVVHDD